MVNANNHPTDIIRALREGRSMPPAGRRYDFYVQDGVAHAACFACGGHFV